MTTRPAVRSCPRWWWAVDFASPVELGQLAQRRLAVREASQNSDAGLVGERPPQRQRSLPHVALGLERLLGRVADDPRVAVLAEQQPGPRGELGRQHDA